MNSSAAGLRTSILSAVGGSGPALLWARSRCKPFQIAVRRVATGVQFRRAGRAVDVSPKHIFFAPEIAARFDDYARAIPATNAESVLTADYASQPSLFNMVRATLPHVTAMEARADGFWLILDKRAIILSLDHLIYASDIGENFDRYYTPLVPTLREGLEVLDYSRPGTLQTFRASGLQFEMASFPEEEDELVESFRWYQPKAGDLVFDMGAHCGVSTYHLSQLVGPTGKVVAFEPDPVNFALLTRNMQRYGVTNVDLENTAIAGTSGTLSFSSEGSVGSKLMDVLGRESVGSVVSVKAMTLADVFARWGTPNFCKIDIEGAEIEVLAKSEEVLRKHPTQFALDTCHLKADGQTTHADVEQYFRAYGYEVLSEAQPLMSTWARPKAG